MMLRYRRCSLQVSIHAPREGCDLSHGFMKASSTSFNSRTPGGVRLGPSGSGKSFHMFQFTHPGRGATISGQISGIEYEVSIHAPREGCDITHSQHRRERQEFQFTHPGRGAT